MTLKMSLRNCLHRNNTHLFSPRTKVPDRKQVSDKPSCWIAELTEKSLKLFSTLHRQGSI